VLWDALYSGCRRVDGELVLEAPKRSLRGDADCVVLAVGSNKVYKADHTESLHESPDAYARTIAPAAVEHFSKISVEEMFETRGLYVPAEGLKAIFGAEVGMVDPGDAAVAVFPNGDRYEFYNNSILVKKNDTYIGLKKPCVLICGWFYVPIEEIAGDILGKYVSMAADVMLISDHYAELGRYTARILRGILGGVQLS